MELTYEQKVYQWASGHFLHHEIPNSFFRLSDEDQLKHLEDNAWTPIEDYKGKLIHLIIRQLANDVIMKRVPEEVNHGIN